MAVKWKPDPEGLDAAVKLIKKLTVLTWPLFYGLSRVPVDRPLLLVGNHTLYGVMDVPFLWLELYTRYGILARPLGDHTHFKIPMWRDVIERMGVVDGTRENFAELMAGEQTVLVFPGGAREATKRRQDKYKLLWQGRLGFARMAIEHGCTIVPFASLGADDAYDVVLDRDEVLATPLGRFLKDLGLRDDVVPPLSIGLGPLPRPERLYFYFGHPIRTDHIAGQHGDLEACRALRDKVRDEVEQGIVFLRNKRRDDPHRSILARFSELFG